ncbi:MAG: hypothetical protein ACK4MW_05295 [Aquificaceae bacterium]
MKFYFFAFILSFLQSAIFSGFFQNVFVAPNLILVYLFLNLLKDDGIKKVIFAGIFLDIFQDSLGLNLSGFLLFYLVFNLFKARFEFPSRLSLLVIYTILASVEKAWTLSLFRIRFYADINPIILFISYLVEIGFMLFLLRWYKNE